MEPTYDPTDAGNHPGSGPLRVGGVAIGSLLPEHGLPSTLCKAAQRQVPATTMVRTMWDGTFAMHDAGPDYLPRDPGEDGNNYRIRLARSTWHNYFRRTVHGLVGLIFRKDPVLSDDVPGQVAEHWENIDMAGTHGDVFLREIEEDAMTAGHSAILVEFPNTGGLRLNRAQEAPLRPYWVPIQKENILSWRTTLENGRRVLTQLVVREVTYEPAGEFGEVEVTRYRVFYRDDSGVYFRLLMITKDNSVVQVGEGVYPTQDEIPVVEVATSGRKSLFESDPPLLDVAWLNLAHYQTWSDYITCIHKTNVPLLFGAGMEPAANDDGTPAAPVVIGPNTFMQSPNPDAKLMYVSHDGGQLSSTKAALDDLVSTMGSLGLSMLAPQKRAAETAEAKRLDKSQGDSALSVSARALQDAVETALGFHAKYLRLPSGGSVEINRDFEGLMMDASVMTAYASLVRDAGLPGHVVLKALQAGGRIPEDENLEELELEMMAATAAAEAQAEQAQQDALHDAQSAGGMLDANVVSV